MDDSTTAAMLAETGRAAVHTYRTFAHSIQSPAIRRVLESFISQKEDVLTLVAGSGNHEVAAIAAPAMPPGFDVKAGLSAIIDHETSFAAAMDTLSSCCNDEDEKQDSRIVADFSRKFTSWAKDHLDLLAMYP